MVREENKLDLVYVTYNSEKWVESCFDSLLKSDFDLKNVSVYVTDNASSDMTLDELEKAKQACEGKVNSFEIVASSKNNGFGVGNNLAAALGKGNIICFLNIDTELCCDTLSELVRDIEISDPKFVLWELRQFPYEHPKVYDPLTHETSWSSGAAFAIRRNVFEKVNGFDKRIFMYAEDVDLSWRLRSFGYHLKYVPRAVIYHYSYAQANEIKPTQYIHSIINNLMLRYRFGSLKDIIHGNVLVISRIAAPQHFKGARKALLKHYLRHFLRIGHFRKRGVRGDDEDFSPSFIGFDYAPTRDGAFYENEFPNTSPLVSVIVRTCGRPEVLRETLVSLRQQTYANFEVVVVEDGVPTARQMIQRDFPDINIRYYATGEKVGRSKAGNIAMTMAKGRYLNFLDDDDLFYADHIEVLVHALEKTNARAAYAFAFETPIKVISKDPYKYEIDLYCGIYKEPFSKIALCHHNYIPIQCIMFENTLFEECGGLDESLDALEDWDMWIRYSLHTDFACIKKTTSIYRVPKDRAISKARQKALDDALSVLRNKEKNYVQQLSAYDIAMIYSPNLVAREVEAKNNKKSTENSEEIDLAYGRMYYLKEFVKRCLRQDGKLYHFARRVYLCLYANRQRIGK